MPFLFLCSSLTSEQIEAVDEKGKVSKEEGENPRRRENASLR